MPRFANHLHHEEVVTAPDGVSFMVRVGRTGVYRSVPTFVYHILALVTFVRYLLRRQRGWTVSVWPRDIWARPEVMFSDDFPSRPLAARRADEIADAIVNGTFSPGPPAADQQRHD
jgi:hypothetical protein